MTHHTPRRRDAGKFDELTERLFSLACDGEMNADSFRGVLLNLTRVSRAYPKAVSDLFREFGDTHDGMSLVGYVKVLDILGFEQFADFPMPGQAGRTLAFVRHRDCLLANLSIEKFTPPALQIVARSIDSSFSGNPPLGFPNELARVESASGKAYRMSIDGSSGLMMKLHQFGRHAKLSDAWWSLDDRGHELATISIGSELVGRRDRFLSGDYIAIRKLVEQRCEAVPSILRYQFDADHRFKLADIISRNIQSPGALFA